MFIESIHIHGFGIFSDFLLDNLSNSLNILVGDNEAGKTTLMEFIRQVLFGFPRKGLKNRKQFAAFRGGRFGGNLHLRMNNNDSIIIRRHKDGQGESLSVHKNGEIQRGLGGLLDPSREDLFRNIFAFSLDELQNVETIENESIDTIIYGVGMGRSGKNLLELNKILNKSMEELFKARGVKPHVNQILKVIEENQKSLLVSQNTLSEYDEIHARRDQLSRELQEQELEIKQLNVKKTETEALLQTIDYWNELNTEKKELLTMPRIYGQHEGMSWCESRQLAAEFHTQVKQLLESKVDYTKAVNDLPERESELRQKENSLETTLEDLGPDWDTDRLLKQNTSAQIREEIRAFSGQLTRTDNTVNQLQNDYRTRRILMEDCQIRMEKAQEKLDAMSAGDGPAFHFSGNSIIRAITAMCIVLLAGFGAGLAFGLMTGIIITAILVFAGVVYGTKIVITKQFYRRELQQRKEEAENAQDDYRKAENEHATIDEQLQNSSKDQKDLVDRWNKWLLKNGLSSEIMPDGALDIVTVIKEAKKHHDDIIGWKERVALVKETIQKFEERSRTLVDRSGEVFPEGLIAVERVAALNERFERQTKLYDKIDDLENQIGKAAGTENRTAWLKERLPSADRIQLKTEIEELAAKLREFEDKKVALHRNIGALNHKIQDLEQKHDISDLLAERESLITKLNSAARRWAVYKTAQTLLNEARTRHEKERQPAIMQKAEKHFSIITEEKYTQVKKPLDGTMLYIADAQDNRKYADRQLSRGTTEELYFSVRLGVISDLGAREESLPVVLDDIFANFDPQRAAAAVRALRPLTGTNQVLVFTCHPEIAELFSKEYQGLRMIELHEGSLTR